MVKKQISQMKKRGVKSQEDINFIKALKGQEWEGVDSRGAGLQPQENANKWWMLFYISFVIFGFFLVMNLFSAIIVDSVYSESSKSESGALSDEQQEWVEAQVAIMQLNPQLGTPEPEAEWRKKFWRLANNKWFDRIMLSGIFLNTFAGVFVAYREPKEIEDLIDLVMFLIQILFTFEAVVKLIGNGAYYVRGFWGKFDIFVTVFAWAIQFMQSFMKYDDTQGDSLTEIVWSMRFAKVVTLFRRMEGLSIMISTVMLSIPSLLNILFFLTVVMYLYAVIGIQLFALVKPNGMIDEDMNFQSFRSAFYSLFKILTGDWNDMMHSYGQPLASNFPCHNIEVTYSNFKKYGTDSCGYPYAAKMYFISYFILFATVLVQLFLAIILKRFDDESKGSKPVLSTKDFQNLQRVWSKFDPDATGTIAYENFPHFIDSLAPPLGFEKHEFQEKRKFLDSSEIKLYVDKDTGDLSFFFHDVMLALTKRRLAKARNLEMSEYQIADKKALKDKKSQKLYSKRRKSLENIINEKPELIKMHGDKLVGRKEIQTLESKPNVPERIFQEDANIAPMQQREDSSDDDSEGTPPGTPVKQDLKKENELL